MDLVETQGPYLGRRRVRRCRPPTSVYRKGGEIHVFLTKELGELVSVSTLMWKENRNDQES
jgi:hypothetical protein